MVGLSFLGNKEHLFDWQIKGTPGRRKEPKNKLSPPTAWTQGHIGGGGGGANALSTVPSCSLMHLSMQSQRREVMQGMRVGIWHYSKVCRHFSCPRANCFNQLNVQKFPHVLPGLHMVAFALSYVLVSCKSKSWHLFWPMRQQSQNILIANSIVVISKLLSINLHALSSIYNIIEYLTNGPVPWIRHKK